MSTNDSPENSVKTNDYNAFFNSILRRLRFALSLDDAATIAIFKLVDYDMEIDYLHAMMKKEEEAGFMPCRDKILALFLDGLIIKKRGKQDNPNAKPIQVISGSRRMTNNDVLRKIRIAMNFREEDMLAIFRLAEFNLGKSELSALFRKSDHRSYRVCQDQLLRNFLQGLVIKLRPDAKNKKA